MEIVREAGFEVAGIVSSADASPAFTIDPLAAASRRRPYGSTGTGSSTASVSLSVFAVAVIVAEPTALAANLQSSRRSWPAAIEDEEPAAAACPGAGSRPAAFTAIAVVCGSDR